MGNCFGKKYTSESLLLSDYNEFSTIQLDSNTNNISRLNTKFTSLESSINMLDNNTTSNIESLSIDIHHLNQEIISLKENYVNLLNTNKMLVKKLQSN